MERLALTPIELNLVALRGLSSSAPSRLRFSNPLLTELDAIVIAEMIRHNPTLTLLEFPRNQLRSVGAAAIANALKVAARHHSRVHCGVHMSRRTRS